MDLKPSEFWLVLSLAEKNALNEAARISTAGLAKELGVSQQTVSRWLISLSALGYVERNFNSARLTDKSRALLYAVQVRASSCLRDEGELVLDGSVVQGMQDGRYYLSLPEYVKQIEGAISFKPFPGTLNLKLQDAKSVEAKLKLAALPGIRISGFRKGGKVFGAAKFFRARAVSTGRRQHEVPCAIILPDYTHYGSGILELVAKESLRKRLGLKNGSQLRVYVNLTV